MFDIKEELKKLPEKPGVYIMKDETGSIIYIGKAVILKNRVKQYFGKTVKHPKVAAMVLRIREFEYIVTDSELEALILECNLIKKHKPKFNILLKDDKNYPYIKVTMNEEYPRIIMTRKMEKDGARYFGPYSNVTAVRDTIGLLKKLFPIKTCNKVFPRDIGKERPCLNYHIYQCLGPCRGDVGMEEYRSLMKDICSFLGGKQEGIVKRLEQQMNEASESLEFEKAAGIRDKISSLRHIAEKQKIISAAMEDQDIIAFARDNTDSCVQVFFIRSGKLIGREHFMLEDVGESDDSEIMTSFIKQFYSAAAFIPSEIVIREDIDELNIIERWLSDKRSSKVHIKVPRRGEKLQMLEMVSQNAKETLGQFKSNVVSDHNRVVEGLSFLSEITGLKKPPFRIEAYDISNTGSTEIVASMIVFENGKLNKNEYRRFKMKSNTTQNDYGSMQETIYRRFNHALKENENGDKSSFSKMPDIILVDGGLGHVNAVLEVMEEFKLNIPVLGMVKDDNHRTRGLVSKENEFDLRKNLNLLRMITGIQDEAHRFAIEYNRKLREKRYRGSVLDEIDGIGPKRKKSLIKHFGSVSRIKEAEIEDLLQADGMTRPLAEKIYEYFR